MAEAPAFDPNKPFTTAVPDQQQQAPAFDPSQPFSVAPSGPTAQDHIVGASFGGSPEDAASALKLGQKLNLPPQVVKTDLPKFKADAERKEAIDAANSNPTLRNWISKDPLNAELAKDDMPALDKLLQSALHFNQVMSLGNMWATANKRFAEGWNSVTMAPGEPEAQLQDYGFFRKEQNEGLMTLPRMFSEMVGLGLVSPAVRFGGKLAYGIGGAWEGILDKAVESGLPRDFAAVAHGEYIPPGPMPGMAVGPTVSPAVKFVREWSADKLNKMADGIPFRSKAITERLTAGVKPGEGPMEKLTPQAEQALREGETPRPGLDPVTDKFHVAQQQIDSAAMDNIMARVEETKLRERSPQALERALQGAVGTQNVHIPAQAISDLYKSQMAHEGDNLFGWVDGGPEKLSNAMATGADVQVPMAEFIAHIDPKVYAEIKDQLRYRPVGVSNEEAKALSQRKPEDYLEEKSLAQSVAESAEDRGPGEGRSATADGETAAKTEVKPPEAVGGEQPPKVVAEGAEEKAPLKDALKPEEGRDKGPPEPPGGDTPLGEAFKRERKWLYMTPLFKEAKAAGVDEVRFAQYSRKIQAQDEATYEKALEAAKREVAKRLEPEWDQAREKIKNEVETDLRSSPAVVADRFIRLGELPTGEIVGAKKLDEAAVNRLAGKSTDAKNLDRYTVKRGGIDPDDLAPMLGFENGQQLVRTLNEYAAGMAEVDKGPLTYFKKLVEDEADRRMEIAHGKLSENILDEARDLAMAAPYMEILSDEMMMLAKLADWPITRDSLLADVDARFAMENAQDVSFEKYRRSAERQGLEAEKALLKGDFRGAFEAKQRQAYSVAFAKEAKAFEKQLRTAEKNFSRIARNETRGSIDQDYWDNARQILSDLNFSEYPVQKPLKTLEDLINESSGQVAVAPWVEQASRQYNELTVEEHKALNDSMRSLLNAGAEAKQVDSVHGRAGLDNVVFDIGKELERFGVKPLKEQQSVRQRIGSFARSINAWNVLVERIFDYTDKFNPNGPLTRFVDRPLREAWANELKLREQTVNKLKALTKYTDNAVFDTIDQKIIKDPVTNELYPMNRHNLRVMMMHLGTASGTEKLITGMKITETQAWDLVRANATANDIKWVNGMHAIYEGLGDQAAPMIRRYTGVEMDKLPPSPMAVRLKDGETHILTGGYTPMNYDKNRGTVENSHALKGDIWDKDYMTAVPAHGYTIARTGLKDQWVDLNGTLMASKMNQIIHDITFREAIRNAQKVLSHPDFRMGMVRHWGPEYANLLPQWLKDIANVQNMDDSMAQNAAFIIAQGRQMVTSTLINYNPSTPMKHGGTAAVMSTAQISSKNPLSALKDIGKATMDVGLKGVVNAARDLLRSQKSDVFSEDMRSAVNSVLSKDNVRDFIIENSPIFRNRSQLYDGTIRGAYEQASGTESSFMNLRRKNDQFGRFAVALSDMVSAMPLWYDTYKKAIARTGEHADAVFEADRVVARAHGSNFVGDKPLVMRQGGNSVGGQTIKTFTSLFGFWNHQFNNVLQWAWDVAAKAKGAAEPGANIQSITNRIFLYGVIPIAVEELAAPALTKEEHGGWAKASFLATVRYLGGLYPGLRELTNSFGQGYEPSTGMLGTGLKMINDGVKDISNPSRSAIAHAGAILGMGGIGSAQVGRTVQGAVKQAAGVERPKTLEEYRALYRKGLIRPRGLH